MQRLTEVTPPTFLGDLFPFVIFSIELCPLYNFDTIRDNFTKLGTNAEINNSGSTYIFCGIIPLSNFQYRNRVPFITLIPFEIISQNLAQKY